MTTAINLFAKPAATLATDALALKGAGIAASGASTTFARSVLATVLGGLSSLDMVASVVIAAMGAPKSPKTGKPIAKVSGLRDFEGGDAIYNAWKRVAFILDNIDADASDVAPATDDAPAIKGANTIRSTVTAFILKEAGAPTALFGSTGVHAFVVSAMTAHAEAIALHNGVDNSEQKEGEQKEGEQEAPVTLADRIALFMVALGAASDETVLTSANELEALMDAIVDRNNAAIANLADATPELESIAA